MNELDKTIDDCLKKAKEYDELAMSCRETQDNYVRILGTQYKPDYSTSKECTMSASKNRQIAEWLRELKKWRALRDSINMLCDVDCEYPEYRESGTMCDACPIGTVKEYFEQIFGVEVNADDADSN